MVYPNLLQVHILLQEDHQSRQAVEDTVPCSSVTIDESCKQIFKSELSLNREDMLRRQMKAVATYVVSISSHRSLGHCGQTTDVAEYEVGNQLAAVLLERGHELHPSHFQGELKSSKALESRELIINWGISIGNGRGPPYDTEKESVRFRMASHQHNIHEQKKHRRRTGSYDPGPASPVGFSPGADRPPGPIPPPNGLSGIVELVHSPVPRCSALHNRTHACAGGCSQIRHPCDPTGDRCCDASTEGSSQAADAAGGSGSRRGQQGLALIRVDRAISRAVDRAGVAGRARMFGSCGTDEGPAMAFLRRVPSPLWSEDGWPRGR
ncbi:hypothetical protein JB92DRAFT_2826682 [Gautieria morchelliformis]|nr:hypothetical protein JB92DRAFT_2826682 [Gautieria morchelliformis]